MNSTCCIRRSFATERIYWKNGMISSKNKIERPVRAKRVSIADDCITVDFRDGRRISVPTKWYPRLAHGTPAERAKMEIWSDGIYWPRLNADISYQGLFLGLRSGESSSSFRRWLNYHSRGEQEPILTLPLPPELAKILKRERLRKRRRTTSRSRRKLIKLDR